MARGWESKSVDAQQEEHRLEQHVEAGEKRLAAVEDRGRESKRSVLMLAKARTVADLEKAGAPAQREMLERALADLDRMIGELSI